MIEKTGEKESVVACDTVAVIGATVLRKLNGVRWRQHLIAADLYEAE